MSCQLRMMRGKKPHGRRHHRSLPPAQHHNQSMKMVAFCCILTLVAVTDNIVGVALCFAGTTTSSNSIRRHPSTSSRNNKHHHRSMTRIQSTVFPKKQRHDHLTTTLTTISSSSSSSSSSLEGDSSDDPQPQQQLIDDDNNSNNENELGLRGGGGAQQQQQQHKEEQLYVAMWPQWDELDQRLAKIALPCIANFAINPLIGAVDLFWVNRMGNALAVAGQAAANQVFNSAFWLASFLPSENAKGDKDGLQDAVCQALVAGILIAMIGTPLLFFQPERVLSSVLKEGAPAFEYANPYLLIRSFAFLPSLISLIGFSAFRGILDTVTPVKISCFANVFNAVLDPILIFTLSLGVPGAALATLGAEVISAITYMYIMLKKEMINWTKLFSLPSWATLEPLLRGGAALQLRNFALNITFLAVTRVTQSIDESGVAAAAHAMAIQTFQIGGIVLLALSTVAQTVVPNEMVERYDKKKRRMVGGVHAAKAASNRLMSWGFILGTVLGAFQIAVLPFLHKSTPLQEVRDAARMPSYLASVFQIMNGLVFIGEGVMVGTGNFMQLSLSTVAATAGCLWALRTFPPIYGLTGVWMGFGVFNAIRLLGVWLNQTRFGPLAPRNMEKVDNKAS